MTWSAPIDRTMSTFLVLHTPVTSAPNDLAIWTANVPTPRRTDDHHLLSRPNPPLITNGIEGGKGRVSNGRGLLEREVARLRQKPVLLSTRVFGKGAVAPAENLIAWLKLLNGPADRFNLSRQIKSRYLMLRLEQADRRTHRVR